uniref:ShKT domain-containing protein n=1 Tax=Rhabditophanes sp. KR3021 TaxID=114890 RepID=A0AC35U9X3_9BILA
MENPYVQENCRLTCGFCHVTGTTAKPCYDTGSNCLDAGICENTIVAMTTCRFTCNECNAMYTGPTLPAEPDYPDYTLPTSSSTCFDTISGCEGMKELCNDPAYQPLMLKECRLVGFKSY